MTEPNTNTNTNTNTITVYHRNGSVLHTVEATDQRDAITKLVAARADLAGADLAGANLWRADLWNANLAAANLVGANLAGADLRDANLGNADLRGANISGANLRDANLWGADLRGAKGVNANISGANISGANISGANLRDANLRGAKGVNAFRVTPLLMLLDQPGKIRAYKLTRSDGQSPIHPYGRITYSIGSTHEVADAETNVDEQCGAGINVATLDWVLKEWEPGYRIFVVEFEAKDIAAIPTATDGKFRLHRCTVVGEKDLAEIGLPVMTK